MLIFDIHVGVMGIGQQAVGEDSELLIHLLSSYYLCLKAENRISELLFEQFTYYCADLPSYRALEKHLVPEADRPL